MKVSLSTVNNESPLLTLQSGYWLRFASNIEDNMFFSVCKEDDGWTSDKEFAIFCIDDSSMEVAIATYLRLTLSEFNDIRAIENQIPSDSGEAIPFDAKGLFAFN